MLELDPRIMAGPLERLKEVLLRRAVKRGKFKLSAGGESTYYINCRKMSMCHDGMAAIAETISALMISNGLRPTVVCGPESAGIPLVSAIVSHTPHLSYEIEGSFVRKEAREHGTKEQIEGHEIVPGDLVLMVEDVATTGTSLIKAIQAVLATGANIIGAVVLVDRLQGAGEKIQQLGVPYRGLLTVKDLELE